MRGAPLAAFLAFLGAALAWLWQDPALRREAYPKGSSFSTGPDGVSLARGYLERRGARVTTLSRPLVAGSLPFGAVLFRIDPQPDRDSSAMLLTDAEDAFVRAGGRLVLAVPGQAAKGAARKVLPLLPGVRELHAPEPRTLAAAALVDAQPVFERDGAPSLARRALGAGEVWLLAEPELLLNRSLGEADHLALLAALAGAGRPVVLDELVHGLRDETGVLELLRRWGLAPALLAGALALCAVFWRGAVTVGPAADPDRDTRSDAVELIDSLAALYRRALSPGEALHLYRARLRQEIALRKGASERVAEALLPQYAEGLDLPPQTGRISAARFRSQLAVLVRAFERLRDEHRRRS